MNPLPQGPTVIGNAQLYNADCRDVLKALPDNSIDSVVTDPPYALVSIVKRFGKPNSAPAKGNEAYQRASAGFMGKSWDTGEVAFSEEFWAEVLRVLKPGGHVVAFSGTRTQHRMVCAIEDAGFEIRDQLGWLYGSGFPKSHDVGNGWGTALKPAWEPICLARKSFKGTVAANVDKHGTGAINIGGCRVPGQAQAFHNGSAKHSNSFGGGTTVSHYRGEWVPTAEGRFPANVIHDGSDEVIAAFPTQGDGTESRFFYCAKASRKDRDEGLEGFEVKETAAMAGNMTSGQPLAGDGTPIATPKRANTHPTVKPTSLMQYLCRLITPPGGVILDPFLGSGSTGKAAIMEGFRFIGCEREAEYMPIAEARIRHAVEREIAAQAQSSAANDNVQADLFAATA